HRPRRDSAGLRGGLLLEGPRAGVADLGQPCDRARRRGPGGHGVRARARGAPAAWRVARRRADPHHRLAVPRGGRDASPAPRAPSPAGACAVKRRHVLDALGLSALGVASFGGLGLAVPRGQTGELLRSRARLPRPYTVPLPVPAVARPVRTDATTDFYEL